MVCLSGPDVAGVSRAGAPTRVPSRRAVAAPAATSARPRALSRACGRPARLTARAEASQQRAGAAAEVKAKGSPPPAKPARASDAPRAGRDGAATTQQGKLAVGAVVEGTVELANRGGVVVRLAKDSTGFVPLSQIDPARVPPHAPDAPIEAVLAPLVGQRMRASVLEVNADKGTAVLSEKAAAAAAELASIAVGAVRAGTVKKLTDYGAFVELLGADGAPHGVEGLLHISELSWSRVRHPEDVLSPGQRVTVKVVGVDTAQGRIALSLRQLAADPLLETLDTILPPSRDGAPGSGSADTGASGGAAEEVPLPGLLDICEALRRIEGIDEVTLGRQAREQRVVSQDLELWLTNDPVADGYNLVARAGRTVQEVHVRTRLRRDDIKAAVQRCTARVK